MREPSLAFDYASVRRTDADGHLHLSSVNMSKACVSHYMGDEIPDWQRLGLAPGRMYALYRDPVEMQKAVASFNGKPLTVVHKAQTAQDHDHEITVGAVSNMSFDGVYLKGSAVIWDGDAIDKVEDKSRREISCGYAYAADMQPRTLPDGTRVDGTMRNIRGNHVCLVSKGRVGSDCYAADAAPSSFCRGRVNNMSVATAVQEIMAARAEVAHVVGEVGAMDSANAVFCTALDRLGVPSAAFRAGGARQAYQLARGGGRVRGGMAADAATVSTRAVMFPNAGRLR